jgi:hypothetical protein
MKRANALIIVIIMIGGIFGTIGYLRIIALPSCPSPPPSGTPRTYGQLQPVTMNNKTYWEYNVAFNGTGESVDIASFANFVTTDFVNPNFPHLVAGACIAEPNTPFQATIRVTFKNDGTSQYFSFSYGGNPPAPPVSRYTINHRPEAGVLWSPGNNYTSLLVSTT